MKMGKIDWTKFNDRYVRLVTGEEKILRLSNWADGEWFGKPGLSFDVTHEDAQEVQKQFTVTSSMLIRLLKPILMKAEQEKRTTVAISILRTGEGRNIRYAVNELPIVEKL